MQVWRGNPITHEKSNSSPELVAGAEHNVLFYRQTLCRIKQNLTRRSHGCCGNHALGESSSFLFLSAPTLPPLHHTTVVSIKLTPANSVRPPKSSSELASTREMKPSASETDTSDSFVAVDIDELELSQQLKADIKDRSSSTPRVVSVCVRASIIRAAVSESTRSSVGRLILIGVQMHAQATSHLFRYAWRRTGRRRRFLVRRAQQRKRAGGGGSALGVRPRRGSTRAES
ncbi:hypothetical protein GW17_00036277 [Ensete ventricosum]|nr:hypothetical protein GW17_00036277 [Ensete ventricosum]